MSAKELHLDIESFSEADLRKVGVYKYAEHPSTRILTCSYRFGDEGPVSRWVPDEGEDMPFDLMDALNDPAVLLVAWNAAFERTMFRIVLGIDVPVRRWRCAMIQSWAVGLPGTLEKAGEAIGLPQDKQKLKIGRGLINTFCKPKKPSKRDASTRWTHENAPEKWEQLKLYCDFDVVAEGAIWHKLRKFRLSEFEQELYAIDQEINDFGIAADVDLANAAIAMGKAHRDALVLQVQRLTGVDNPNSTAQLKDWINARLATASAEERAAADEFLDELDDLEADRISVDDLQKKTVERLLKNDKLDSLVRQVLELRRQIAKSSLKKYETIVRAVCADGRVRGMMQFYGAFRTGRWAGRLLQVQNLPSPTIEDLGLLKQARALVKAGDYDTLHFMFPSVSDVLATLIRTALVAGPGRRLLDVDFSAIEAVITAWFAACQWRLEVFRTHGKIYEASASTAFKVPFDEMMAYKKATGKHHPLRKKGKVIELACGYQGGNGALIQMGALDMGIPEEELAGMVRAWRDASPEIEAMWYAVENAMRSAIQSPGKEFAPDGRGLPADAPVRGVRVLVSNGMMRMKMPSGRCLCYIKPRLAKNAKGRLGIKYWGINQKTKQWCELDLYGGRGVENLVQAFARDCLAVTMVKLYRTGYQMIMLVHDEIVFDLPLGFGSLAGVLDVMREEIPFAKGLPLKGAGYDDAPFYYKD